MTVEIEKESSTEIIVNVNGKKIYFDLKGSKADLKPIFDDVKWGICLWESSVVLSNYLLKAFDSVENKVVIEISGGLGLPGIVSSFIKAKKVIITEKQPEISYLSRSIKLNGLTEEVKVEELDWLSNSQLQELLSKYSTIDYALLADCVSLDVYGEICLKALVNVLSKLKEKFSDIKFIICSKLRSNDGFPLFLKLLKERKLVKYDTLVLKEGECEVHCF